MPLTYTQKKARIGRITSSVAPAILGADRYVGWHGAYRRIMGLHDEPETEPMQIGTALEKPIGMLAAKRLQLKYQKAIFKRHGEHPSWIGDSTDCLFLDDEGEIAAIGEVKTAGLGKAQEYGDEGEIPQYVQVQAQHHLMHWPSAVCYVITLLATRGPLTLRIDPVYRDQKMQRLMLDTYTEFHRKHIVPKEPPFPDDKEETARWLDSQPLGDGAAEMPPKMVNAIRERAEYRQQIRALEDQVRGIDNMLKSALLEHGEMRHGDMRVSITEVPAASYTTTRKAYRRLVFKGV